MLGPLSYSEVRRTSTLVHCTVYCMSPQRWTPPSFHSEPHEADVYGWNQLGFPASAFRLGLTDGRDWQEVRRQKESEMDILIHHSPSCQASGHEGCVLLQKGRSSPGGGGPFLPCRSPRDPATTPSPCYGCPLTIITLAFPLLE